MRKSAMPEQTILFDGELPERGDATDDLGTFAEPAPPFRPLLPARPSAPSATAAVLPQAGEHVGDFELLRVLGAGSFGRVYLARQTSLGRPVALKVSAAHGSGTPGGEARTLARLEHAHIVQVFSETVDPERRLRLLCMQYVPGATLEEIGAVLGRHDRRMWNGQLILDILDAANSDTVPLDPAALREREFLACCPFDEAVGWLGARLAEALAHAHALGVLHRDVKPANVLLNRYGRPMLADFNVAFVAGGPAALGGTLTYMAPEHLDAFVHTGPTTAVDERADVYSLGVVLFELLAGGPAFGPPRRGTAAELVRELMAQRRVGPPDLPLGAAVPVPLAATLRRCLEPDPACRFQSAAELARALDGCTELRHVDKALPRAGALTRALQRWPLVLGCVLVLLPHLVGSVVNVSYNALRIVGELTAPQKTAFFQFVLGYNAVVYPACVALLILLGLPPGWVRRRLARRDFGDPQEDARARQLVLRLPLWAVLLSCVGWLPGGLLFPLWIDFVAGPIPGDVLLHFLVSFTISGLIALTYSFLAIEYVALRVLYPALWSDAHDLRTVARTELRGQGRRLGWAQLLAVLIPLLAAVLMVGVGPEEFSQAGYRTFRLLVTALIALGMAGLGVAMAVSRLLNDTLAALTGGERAR
jgi:serine/threonine protein kinase